MLVDWGIFMGVLNLPFKVVPIEKKDLLGKPDSSS